MIIELCLKEQRKKYDYPGCVSCLYLTHIFHVAHPKIIAHPIIRFFLILFIDNFYIYNIFKFLTK